MTKIQDTFLYSEAVKELEATFKCTEQTSDKNNMAYVCHRTFYFLVNIKCHLMNLSHCWKSPQRNPVQ